MLSREEDNQHKSICRIDLPGDANMGYNFMNYTGDDE